jgi:ferritin-like metal-binding protein YciE
MAENGFRELYLDELRDLYSAETQLVKALPKMAKAANSDELREGFEEHLEQTKGHVERLEQIFEAMDESPKGHKCAGMEGLIKEGSDVMDEDFNGAVLDAALIGAAQRVEHYEIAAYGTIIAFAEQLGESEHVSPLKETLEEEKATDEKLTSLSEDINAQANSESGESEDLNEEDDSERREAEPESDGTANRKSRKSPKRAA